MRRIMIPAFLLSFSLPACSADSATAPEHSAPAFGPSAAVHSVSGARPLTGRCEAITQAVLGIDPPIIHQLSTGTCQLSHLGRVALSTVQHINFLTGAQTAEVTYTAPNGDLLYGTNVGTSTPAGPGTIAFSGTTTLAGGTGRFANATGAVEARGTGNLVTSTATFTFAGWIAYTASDRGGR